MSAFRPPDADVRDRIVSVRGVTQAIEAGAGTGKTRLLVDRVLSRLEEGVPLGRLAVITFTKKAAAELVSRIRRRLIDRRGEPWAAAALDSFDGARIGTTDSFCHDILARYPLEAGVPPGFGVADEIAQQALRDAAWARFLENHRDEGSRVLGRLRRAGAAAATLRDRVEELLANRDLDPALPPAEGVPDLRVAFGASLDAALALVPLCRDPGDKLLLHLRELEREHAIAATLDAGAAERLLSARKRDGRKYSSRRGKAAAWGGKAGKERVTAALDDLEAAVDAWFDARGRGLARDLLAWAGAYRREYEQLKRERGLLDFRDLALATRDLLRDRPAVRRRISARFEEILMDEVQDTDPLQMEIAFLLAAEGEIPRDPLEARLTPGKLFLVGDPKQSIYRFRRADIELYERAVERIATAGETPRIRANFRSRPGILRFVNHVFRDWMQPEPGTRWQARYDPLVPARDGADAEPRVHLLLPDPAVRARLLARSGRDAPSAEERRELELDAVVRAIAHVLGRDGRPPATVRDPETGEPRPAEPRDVAVLVRKIDWGDRLLDALRHAGVPAGTTGGRRYWAREEIQTLRVLLEAVVAPEDRLARFAALRSLVFGLTDDELVLHFLGEGPEDSAAARADRRLSALGEEARARSVPDFLDHLVTELCVLPTFGFRPDGAGRIESVRMLLESADSLVDAGFDSLPDFVRWLRDQSEEPRAEGLGETEPGAEGGVQILTMHKAKGLEFPIVLLADLSGEPRQDAGLVVDRTRGALEFRVARRNGIATPGYDAARDTERARRSAEDVRLLYVAMTRARDRLLVSWTEGSGGFLQDGRLAEAIGAAAGDAPPVEPDGDVAILRTADLPPQTARRRLLTVDVDRPRIPHAPEADALPAAGNPAARGPRLLRVTDLTPAGSGPRTHAADADPEGAFRGRTFGRLIHSALELAGPEADADALARRAAARLAGALAREGDRLPDDLVEEAVPYLRRVLADPAVAALWRAPRVLREVPFLVPVGDDLLSGTLDVVVEGSGGALTILDWKTDRLGGRTAESARERYRAQALAYAWAASRLTGRRVLEVRFVFLSADPLETASFEVDDDFLLQARARLGAAVVAGGIPGGSGPDGL